MFSTEEFIRQYQNLANPNKTISRQANQYILKLQQRNEAFALQKNYQINQIFNKNINSQHKIKGRMQYFYLAISSITTIKTFTNCCFELSMFFFCCDNSWKSIIMARVLFLNDTNILQELIELMKAKMTIGIEILTQIAIQGKEWYKKGEQSRLQQEFISQENTLSEIFLNLFYVQDLSIFNQTVYCIECWVQFSYNLFKDQKLTQQILGLINQTLQNNATEYSDKLFTLLNEGVIFSQYNSEQNINSIEPVVLQNLNLILEFLIKIYSPQMSKGYAQFATKFICNFYAIVFNQKYEQSVFNLMGNIVSNPSRKIAFQTFEFWSQMREYNKLQGFGLNILQTMIDKCRMKTIKLTKKFLQGEPEEEDTDYNIKQVGQHFISTSDFREHSKDIFYSIYKSAEMNNQSDQYFQIVLSNLAISNSDQYIQIIQSESALFSLCSIIDEADIQVNNQLILQIIQFILSLPVHQNFDIIIKTSLQMLSEFTNQLKLNDEVLLQITSYFFKYMLHPLLGPLAGVAFEQICNLSTLNNAQLISESVRFLELHFNEFINQSQVSNYIDGIIKLSYRLFEQGNTDCLIQLFNFANQQFKQLKNPQITERQFNYNNTLVITILQWINLNAQENDQIKQLQDLLCQSIFEPLLIVLQGLQSFSIYDEIFKLIQIILKVSNYQNQQQIIHLLQISFQIFHTDPIQKHNWLQLITQAIGRTCDHQFIVQWAKIYDYQIHIFCIESFKCWKDPDLMKVQFEYVKECIRCCQQVLFESPNLQNIIHIICDAFQSLNSFEMQREILHFFKILFQSLDNSKEYFYPLLMKIITTLFIQISDINPAIVFQVVQILQLVLQKQVNQNELEELIFQSLQKNWGKDKPPQKVKVVSQAIISYLLKSEKGEINRNLKLLLENLRPVSEEEINYMQLELVIKRK
ncbi:unnamed protein product [Paramecium sonneborni]|uniref:Uncharacterized protein n=1 Tax=Paramecium sonneborni TaxID=65129 RepID=A0A8S1M2B7_9CILI|nr:unnamed protein product [Paramecium sonneborni]